MSGKLWTPPEANLGELDGAEADFGTHRIEGFAHQGGAYFSAPLISQIDENLWTGGCLDGTVLPARFRYLVSLYPWERYEIAHELEGELTVRLLDSNEVPDPELLEAIAAFVNFARARGETLVHCQAGLNRSGLVAALALVRSGVPPADAVALLRERRCAAVLCNVAFERWLLALDD